MEHFDKVGVVVADDLTVSHIQRGNRLHILLGKLEIPNIEVLFHTVPVDRLWNNYHAPLDVPAQGDPGGRFAVLVADLYKNRMGENAKLALVTDLHMERDGIPKNRVVVPIIDEQAEATYYCVCRAESREKYSRIFRELEKIKN